jgi:hypothetical protein
VGLASRLWSNGFDRWDWGTVILSVSLALASLLSWRHAVRRDAELLRANR